MSLYYEAAQVLTNADNSGGSLKSRLYKQTNLKSSPAQLFALISETSKWSLVLKDVIEKCDLLGLERKLTPLLALLLTHDLVVSKGGVVAPANHVLKLAIHRHKARLSAEFTKARLRRGYPSLEAFKQAVNDGALEEGHQTAPKANRHPRWVRVNALVTSLKEQLATTFSGYDEADSLARVMAASASTKLYFPDPNIPNLLAFPPKIDLSKSSAYTSGKIIFQDKASCFPAHLLNLNPQDGDVVDGCAAPGNKTTHLAAIVSSFESETTKQRVIAFERDKTRTGTLKKMVKLASAGRIVSVKGGADFLAAAPDAEEFSGVGALVLDPSCTGSGIVGRDDAIRVHLPDQASAPAATVDSKKSKKRKRGDEKNDTSKKSATLTLDLDDSTPEETPEEGKLSDRLIALSTFQFRILTHAMRFPNAHKITYSTCSIHFEENEGVVARALASPAAKEGGWRILERDAQVDGLNIWQKRGLWEDGKLNENIEVKDIQKQEICDACIRCEKGNEDGTMGFFVAAFTRDVNSDVKTAAAGEYNDREDDDEWTGFGDTDQDAAVKPAEKVLPSVSPHSKNKKKKRSNKS